LSRIGTVSRAPVSPLLRTMPTAPEFAAASGSSVKGQQKTKGLVKNFTHFPMSIVYENVRIRACASHRLQYNAEDGRCPLCGEASSVRQLAAEAKPATRGAERFPCPYCGGRSKYEGCCCRYACRKRAGLVCKSRSLVNRCIHCGGRTKYPSSCTRYRCRQQAGTMNMYYRRK
jgi:hypothetical protein